MAFRFSDYVSPSQGLGLSRAASNFLNAYLAFRGNRGDRQKQELEQAEFAAKTGLRPSEFLSGLQDYQRLQSPAGVSVDYPAGTTQASLAGEQRYRPAVESYFKRLQSKGTRTGAGYDRSKLTIPQINSRLKVLEDPFNSFKLNEDEVFERDEEIRQLKTIREELLKNQPGYTKPKPAPEKKAPKEPEEKPGFIKRKIIGAIGGLQKLAGGGQKYNFTPEQLEQRKKLGIK